MGKFDLTGTKTAMNLAAAFVGECQARNRYQFYAETAADEDFKSIEHVFLETADNERGHAEMFYDYLTTGLKAQMLTPTVNVAVEKSTTLKNLFSAASGENEEAVNLYPGFAKIAEQEGFSLIAESFSKIATIEKRHYFRYMNLYKRFQTGQLYTATAPTDWLCLNCGLIHHGKSAPEICPACHHPQSYYILSCDAMTLY